MPTLIERAQEIRNAILEGENTAERVGSLLEDMIAYDEVNFNILNDKASNLLICSQFTGFNERIGYAMDTITDSIFNVTSKALVLEAKNIYTDEIFDVKENQTLRFHVPEIYEEDTTSGNVVETYKDFNVFLKVKDFDTEETNYIFLFNSDSASKTKICKVSDVYGKTFDVSVAKQTGGDILWACVIGGLIADEIEPSYDTDSDPIVIDEINTTYTITGDETSIKNATSSIDGGEIILDDISIVTENKGIIINIQAGSNPIVIDAVSYNAGSVISVSTSDGGTTWSVSDLTESLNVNASTDVVCSYYYPSISSVSTDSFGISTIIFNDAITDVYNEGNRSIICEQALYVVTAVIDTDTILAKKIQDLSITVRFYVKSESNYYYAKEDNVDTIWATIDKELKTLNGQSLLGSGNIQIDTILGANVISIDSVNGVEEPNTIRYKTLDYFNTNYTNLIEIDATRVLGETKITVSDVDNDKIEEGMFIEAVSGVFSEGTFVYKKNNEGSDANTVEISKPILLGGTSYFLKLYKPTIVEITGTHLMTVNSYKQGVYLINKGQILVNNTTFLNVNTEIPTVPYWFKNEGYIACKGTSSKLYNEVTTTSSNTIDHYADLDFGNCYSEGTGYGIEIQRYDTTSYYGNYTIKRNLNTVGKIENYQSIRSVLIDGNSEGLLEGTRIGKVDNFQQFGTIKTPTAINAIYMSVVSNSIFNGNIYGSQYIAVGLSNKYVNYLGSVVGSTFQIVTSNTAYVDFNGFVDIDFDINSTNSKISINNGFIGDVDLTVGTVEVKKNGITTSGSSVIGGKLILDFDCLSTNATLGISGGLVVNKGKTCGVRYNLIGGDLDNFGEIEQINANAAVIVGNANSRCRNFGTIENTSTGTCIEKSAGRFENHGGLIKAANGLNPIRCTLNTSASKDIYWYFGSINYPDVFTIPYTAGYVPNPVVLGFMVPTTDI